MPRLYPLFADLDGRRVLVVGGGAVAERKIAALQDTGAWIRVVAPVLSADLQVLAGAHVIDWQPASFHHTQLDGIWLVIAATSDPATNRRIADAAAARGVFINVVDDATLSMFHVPAVVRRGKLQVAVSSAGAAPVLATWVREQLERLLDDSVGRLAELLSRWRKRIRQALPDLARRRRFYAELIAGEVATRLRSRRPERAETTLARQLSEWQSGAPTRPGRVALVGAGPGDAGLLTLRGLRLLQRADVILHDRLVGADVLALARRDALFIEVGKRAGVHAWHQDAINECLYEQAAAGRFVVRLKGGDPFIFGRGGEELEYLREHGIDYEVVPGVTAASACAAYAGVPLTHRVHAQSVRFVTAHCSESIDTLDWDALAQERQTLAVYMGVGQLARLRENLLAHGRAPTTPYALIQNGTTEAQRVLTGTLAELPEQADAAGIRPPAMLILGEVAGLANSLGWYGEVLCGDCSRAAA